MKPALIDVQGRAVEAVLAGEGDRLIVLESGLADDWTSWLPVLDPFAARGRVLAYSRPGYGLSTEVCTPRDIRTEASELRALLQALGETPPYVLVGHSLGGLIVQALAADAPGEVAGLVSIDAPHPDQIEYLNRDASEAGKAYRAFAQALTGAAYLEHVALTAAQGGHFLSGSNRYGGPMIMLSAWLRPDAPAAYRDYRREKAIEAAASYPQAELRRIHCTHYIHRERPLAVIDAVDEVLARAS